MEDGLIAEAKEILAKIPHLTLATANREGTPWNSPVFTAWDEQYNFYWNSSVIAQHSKNIAENPRVFAVIYDSTSEGSGRAVYIQAKAQELASEQDIEQAGRLLYGRKNMPPKPAADFMNDRPRRMYKAVPEQLWVNTNQKLDGHHHDGRVEIHLS